MDPKSRKITNGVLRYLESQKCLHLLPEVIRQLQAKAAQMANDRTAIVSSTYKLSSKELGQIQKALEVVFNKKLKVINKVEPELIAGLRIAVRDKIIDMSFDKHLDNLKSKLDHD